MDAIASGYQILYDPPPLCHLHNETYLYNFRVVSGGTGLDSDTALTEVSP